MKPLATLACVTRPHSEVCADQRQARFFVRMYLCTVQLKWATEPVRGSTRGVRGMPGHVPI